MAKAQAQYVCKSCGAIYPRWAGRCDACNEWNTLVEEAESTNLPKGISGGRGGRPVTFFGLKGETATPPRLQTGIAELDRVCGSGLVPGSAILVGGDPGIGKSTLLLQACGALAESARCLYITGEEAVDQVRLRASRLDLDTRPVELATATNVRDIAASLDSDGSANLVVIDSIQTMYSDSVDSAPGTVNQVRTCSHELIRLAKKRGFTLFLVGHVTKEGTLAGPRLLEHMVDTVLYFEGERGHHFRILRAVKNRFGATDEIGVFEMVNSGLVEVPNPSTLFLAERRGNVSGSCVFAGMEGTRPMLVEIQALVAPTNLGTARRTVVGWDPGRLSMIAAVLEARCRLALSDHDIYLNVAGGLRISEPAADAAVAAALVSSLLDMPAPAGSVVFGEIGLSGEVRAVTHMDQRLREAAKLGFTDAWMPKNTRRKANDDAPQGVAITSIGHVQTLVDNFA